MTQTTAKFEAATAKMASWFDHPNYVPSASQLGCDLWAPLVGCEMPLTEAELDTLNAYTDEQIHAAVLTHLNR